MLLVCVRGIIVHARYALPSVYIGCAVSMSTARTRKMAQYNKKIKKSYISKHRTHDLYSDKRLDCLLHHLVGVHICFFNHL